ncbi:MAG: sigma factor-like helix-turn-helix DNA-binding protein [Gaiellales bacterium]
MGSGRGLIWLTIFHPAGGSREEESPRAGWRRADQEFLAGPAPARRPPRAAAIAPQLAAALDALSPDLRRVLELRVVDELDYGELARIAGISEPHARMRASIPAIEQVASRRHLRLPDTNGCRRPAWRC